MTFFFNTLTIVNTKQRFCYCIKQWGRICSLCVAWTLFHKDLNNLLNIAVLLLGIEPLPVVTLHHTIFLHLNDPHHLANQMPDFPPVYDKQGYYKFNREEHLHNFKDVLDSKHTPSYYYYLLIYYLVLFLQVTLESYC